MFLDLQALSNNEQDVEDVELNYEYEKNVNNIRARYGLKVLIDEKTTGLENLFDSNIVGALEIKIENEMDLPIHVETNAIDETEFIEEDVTVEGEEEASDIEDHNDSNFREESEDSMSFKEEEEENESISDEFEEKVRKQRRGRKANDDREVFE